MKTLPRVTDIRPIQPGRVIALKAIQLRDAGNELPVVTALLNWDLRASKRSVSDADVARMWASVEAQPEAR